MARHLPSAVDAMRRASALVLLGAMTVAVAPALLGADARADACSAIGSASNCVTMWNADLVSFTTQASAPLVNGPPEVANQIAIVGTAMYDAVNAATGGLYQPTQYNVGSATTASASAAALAAGYGTLMGLFAPITDPVTGASVTGTSGTGASGTGTSVTGTSVTGNPLAGLGTLSNSDTFGGLLATLPAPAGKLSASQSIVAKIQSDYAAAYAQLNTSDPLVQAGLALGSAQALATLTGRLNDKSVVAIKDGLNLNAPAGQGTPGVYTPPSATGGRPEMYPLWGSVTPWTMTSSIQFAPPPPPAISTPAYAASLLATECLGSRAALPAGVASVCAAARTTAQASASAFTNTSALTAGTLWNATTFGTTDTIGGSTKPTNAQLALYWNDPGSTFQPPGHWLQITDIAITAAGFDVLQSARITAEVGVATADAGITAWQAKYTYDLWRPIAAINDCSGWNPAVTCDPGWTSVIATPPHPDYIAGHPAFSYSAATVLDKFFGSDNSSFCSTTDPYNNGATAVPAMTVCYNNFLDAASDATVSRVYGGIHTDIATAASAAVGVQIGANIAASHFQLVPEPVSLALFGTGLVALAGLRRLYRRRSRRKN